MEIFVTLIEGLAILAAVALVGYALTAYFGEGIGDTTDGNPW